MEIWVALISLFGVLLGWGLTQTSTWLATRQADKRILCEVLYSLLELHKLLYMLEGINTLFPKVLSAIKTAAPSMKIEPAVDTTLENILRDAVIPLVGQQLAALKDGYNAGLLKLAAVDPINAYRLRGREEIIRKIPQMIAAVHASSEARLGVATPIPPEFHDFFRRHVEADEIAETRALVRDILNQLARRIDKKTQAGLSDVWAKSAKQQAELQDKLDNTMRKMVAELSPNAN